MQDKGENNKYNTHVEFMIQGIIQAVKA